MNGTSTFEWNLRLRCFNSARFIFSSPLRDTSPSTSYHFLSDKMCGSSIVFSKWVKFTLPFSVISRVLPNNEIKHCLFLMRVGKKRQENFIEFFALNCIGSSVFPYDPGKNFCMRDFTVIGLKI